MAKTKHRGLLAIDAIVNLLLGVLLLAFPAGVIFGIGVALCIEWWGAPGGAHGLGLSGAIVINICGAAVLLIWLLLGGLDLPLRGLAVLWGVALVVLGIGVAEIAAR